MKVICNINNELHLTFGKIYEVKETNFDEKKFDKLDFDNSNFFYLINDKGQPHIYQKKWFITVEEHRDKILNDLLKK